MNWVNIVLKILKILPQIIEIFVDNNPGATREQLRGMIQGHINLMMPTAHLTDGNKDIKGIFDVTTQNLVYQAIENELTDRGIK